MTVNDRIKQIRKNAKLTQAEFAKTVNLAANTINRIEKATRNPAERTILYICEKYKVNYDWLKYGEGEMYKESDQSILTLLKAEYDLTDTDIKILKGYLSLSSAERQSFFDIFKKMFNNI